jgi:TrmH family RNA methyltransferase
MRCMRPTSKRPMRIRLITSKHNPLLKRLRLAAARTRRAPPDLVIAEGMHAVEEATAAGCMIEVCLVSTRFGNAQSEKHILEEWSCRRIEIYQAPEPVVRSVSDVVTPQGVIALVRVPLRSLSEFKAFHKPLILCAWGVQDPGNLGTLIRTAAAAGAAMVCTLAGTVSPRNPKSIRSSAGAFFRIPVVEEATPEQFFMHCRTEAIVPYRTSPTHGIPYFEADFTHSCAVLLGNEGSGVPQGNGSSLPSLRIPMAPGVESLNVAAAGAVLMLEAHRQRTGSGKVS